MLCQFLDDVDYATAFKALQERATHDAMDTYYDCIWDVTILEYLISIFYTHLSNGGADLLWLGMENLISIPSIHLAEMRLGARPQSNPMIVTSRWTAIVMPSSLFWQEA